MTISSKHILTTRFLSSIATIIWLLTISSALLSFDPSLNHPDPLNGMPISDNSDEVEEELIRYLRSNGLAKEYVSNDDLKAIFSYANEAANAYEYLNAALILAVIATESNFDRDAYNGTTLGLMQLNPVYHIERLERIKGSSAEDSDLYEPRVNVLAGSDYLNEILDQLQSYTTIAKEDRRAFGLMWYNMGALTASDAYFTSGISHYAQTVMERNSVINGILTKGDARHAETKGTQT